MIGSQEWICQIELEDSENSKKISDLISKKETTLSSGSLNTKVLPPCYGGEVSASSTSSLGL